MATDALVEMGGKLAKLSEESLRELDSILPKYWFKGNPVDLVGDANIERFVKATQTCLKDAEVDGLLLIYVPQAMIQPVDLAQASLETLKKARKPILAAWIGGAEVEKGKEILIHTLSSRPIRQITSCRGPFWMVQRSS